MTWSPVPLTSRFVGGCGAVMSGASAVSGGLRFPAGSVAIAVMVSPLVCGGLMVMVNVPSGPATPLPI